MKGARLPVAAEEIQAAMTPAGGWTKDQLAKWGVGWPPPKGWRKAIILGLDPYDPRTRSRVRAMRRQQGKDPAS